MISEYQNITGSPSQDFSSTAPKSVELKTKTALMELIYPERTGELDTLCKRLERMLVKEPSGKYLLEFDVMADGKGRPAKYSKQQVYNILDQIVPFLEVNQNYFFWWVATMTNLSNKPNTVKTMHKRALDMR